MKYKHIAISPESFGYLDALARSWEMDKKTFAQHMIMYFRLTGEDPTATKKDNTVVAMKRLQTTLISFIRAHETDHLKKIVTDFEETRKGLSQSQTDLIDQLKTTIETGRKEDKMRLGAWMVHGMKLPDETVFSLKDRSDKLAESDQQIIKLITEQHTKSEKKNQVLIRRLETMDEEIKKWATLTKDGNKEKAASLIEEIKTLIGVAY
jgi:succinate dehydrogenase flavin-adding protein (antitoxin of CptAB toxin-antitoxin module)